MSVQGNIIKNAKGFLVSDNLHETVFPYSFHKYCSLRLLIFFFPCIRKSLL